MRHWETPRSQRLLPLDALRGLLMVLMALDHANALVAHGKLVPELWVGTFPDYRGDSLLFMTRFVTHLAAPGFFFLMGAGMILFASSRHERGWTGWRIVRHFLLRGAVLIMLQFTLENAAWKLGEGLDVTYVGVLFALGGAMALGSLLLSFPTGVQLTLGTVLIAGTEILLPKSGSAVVQYSPLLRLWLIPGYTDGIYALYPIMPWLGVTVLGMAYGRWLQRQPQRALRTVPILAMVALMSFVVVRALNGFGNIRPVHGADWIAFLNLVKYPPSIVFLLMALGLDGLLLGVLVLVQGWIAHGLAIFGRAPLFFYLAHLYLYALLGLLISPNGTPVRMMYPYWLLGLIILFPLCWVFGPFKQARSAESWWRLF
ncbi:MAG: heparan-alpha-glucosaminide N-acetyltransferase domain-containing protein [Anaerolineae bacterium]